MDTELLTALIINASLLISLSLVYHTIFYRNWKKSLLFNILLGLIIGLMGIVLMANSVVVSTGIIFDTRSILVSVVGLFLGFIPTAIAVVILSVYRIILGGSGAFTGVLVTVLTAAVGLLWHQFRLSKILQRRKSAWLEFYLFGFITHIVMLGCMLSLPADRIISTLKQIYLPILALYPFVSMILCLVAFYALKNVQTEEDLKASELRLRTMFEQAPIGIVIQYDNMTFYHNSMYEKILGRTQEEIDVEGWENFTHPDDLKEELAHLEKLKSGAFHEYSMVKRYYKPDGELVWANLVVSSLRINNQTTGNYVCMIQDITQIKNTENDLKESEVKYKNLYHEYQEKQTFLQSLLNTIPAQIFYKDIDGIYKTFNKAFQEACGVDSDSIMGHSDYDVFDKELADHIRELDEKMYRQCKELTVEELANFRDGRKAYLETMITPFYDAEGEISGLIGTSRDITERKRKEEEIIFLNHHDVLTGLYNRTFFDDAVRRFDTPEYLPLSIIIGDINGLKFVNDAFGHAKGDILLIEMAKILTSCCRPEDIVARTGGDEFCILLPGTDSAASHKIVDRIKKTCEEYVTQTEKETYYTSISLGYETKTNTDEYFGEILHLAEEHMYRHKLLEHKSLHSAIISSIKTTMFEKSNETEEHAERMAELAKKLGSAMDFNENDLVSLELVTTLHDIGKISIDQRILDKPGKLTEDEWIEIRKHPDVGYRIALTVPELSRIAEYILCHHERWDGKGYPQQLTGTQIPLISRMLTVIDSYDAMTQDRAYRKAMPKSEAITELKKNAGTQFDPRIVEIFIDEVLKS